MDFLSSLEALDIQLLSSIREFALQHIPYIHLIVRVFADLEPILFALFLIGLWFYGVSEKNNGPKHVALDLFWHVMGAFAVYWIINHIIPVRPRPELMLDLPPLINHLPDNSFPSGHAMFW
jgi:membrane-associated phospholipid phosphatase